MKVIGKAWRDVCIKSIKFFFDFKSSISNFVLCLLSGRLCAAIQFGAKICFILTSEKGASKKRGKAVGERGRMQLKMHRKL